jgi:hypothetical protein
MKKEFRPLTNSLMRMKNPFLNKDLAPMKSKNSLILKKRNNYKSAKKDRNLLKRSEIHYK